jgi:hypothetical protein
MTRRRVLFAVFALLLASPVAFGQVQQTTPSQKDTHTFDKAEYFPATPTGQKKAGNSTKGTLIFDTETRLVNFLRESGSPVLSIKFDSIKSMTYEKASKPRYAEGVLISPLFLLSHSKKHYLTIQYTDDAGAGTYAIFRLDKNNARQAIACAEAQTGIKVEQIEEK